MLSPSSLSGQTPFSARRESWAGWPKEAVSVSAALTDGRPKTPIVAFGEDRKLHVFGHRSSNSQHIARARSAARSGGLVDVKSTVAEVRGSRARATAEVINEDGLERRASPVLAVARARAKHGPEFHRTRI